MTAAHPFSTQTTIDVLSSSYSPLSALRLAPNGKIYRAIAWDDGVNFNFPYPDSVYNYVNENLSVINYPDSAGAACNYQAFSQYLNGYRTYLGLPNITDYSLGHLIGSICDTLGQVGLDEVEASTPLWVAQYYSSYDFLHIRAEKLKGTNYQLSITDAGGRLVFSESGKLQQNGCNREINLNALQFGLYIVSLQTDKERFVSKFVKN
jgi:hypothetical protein